MQKEKQSIPNILTIAGSDPSGGAGIQADIKTISACGCYATSVITSLTAQNTLGVSQIQTLPYEFVQEQLNLILKDIEINAIKIGMLANAAIVEGVADCLQMHPSPLIVLDPVLISSSGKKLLAPEAVSNLVARLFPLSTLITPNIPEAETLLGEKIDENDLAGFAQKLADKFEVSVLLKGGHLSGNYTIDTLYDITQSQHISFESRKINSGNLHGTGCTLSSAIASYLGKGYNLVSAIKKSKVFIQGAIQNADLLKAGKGNGPLHHFWSLNK
ncbi:bifunctional hydroxymethylpyrimidine kinase/phosphomethylpyrimidine kinase [Zhouia amylolytica]|uniref:hydroxymethylpyrimidine kinase n=1 Tax=Zhouia amylolytica AD3 TaxID=1286632 RepID=W2USV1_9FLAO|nr:bifunctional hydroxymethylpyrimidine kinase/phosphomethylpyrimidine kinase [Zhouia amylolytica]ETN96561.1 phosphomethylpyrimidine kinase [Zhouia amylolytica AD3]